ncbi:hypothetical protein LCGC14_2125980 [marine sediment metagenome]|uniref:DUF1905 domain-containing protein n=1 Tax=marine sediment metagenome TaxID=412755 RepID=A0A0F9GFY5_9ZZZZ
MEEVSFIGSPAKHGNYFIFQIPNKLIKNDLIDTDSTFKVVLRPIKTKDNSESQLEKATEEI